MSDEKARFHVEFVKEPKDIDQAVYAAVCFQETKTRTNKHYTNDIRSAEISSSDESSDDNDILTARAIPGKNKHKIIKHDKDTNTNLSTNANSDTLSVEKIAEIFRNEVQSLQEKNYNNQNQRSYNKNSYTQGHRGRKRFQNKNTGCFGCGDKSHFIRDCPKVKQNQNPQSKEENSQSLN